MIDYKQQIFLQTLLYNIKRFNIIIFIIIIIIVKHKINFVGSSVMI